MKKLWAYFVFSLALAVFASSQTAAVHSPSILNPRQVPPIAGPPGPTGPQGVPGPAGPAGPAAPQMNWAEIPLPGTAPNTWTLSKPVVAGIDVLWNGTRQSVPDTFTFSGNGSGGTILTLSPAAVALGYWSGTDLIANYQ